MSDALPPGVSYDQMPLAANPSGEPPNFVNPPSLLPVVQGIGITLGFIALGLLVTRMLIMRRSRRPFGLDDASVIIAWICAGVYTGATAGLGEGLMRHAWDTPLSFLDDAYLKKLFVTSLFYGPMLFFAKASILLFFYRTFQPAAWFRCCIYVLLALITGTYWMTVPMCFYYCMPHPNTGQQWDLTILANCNHLATPGLVQAAMNIAVDIAVFCLPLPIVFSLQMPLSRKLSVAGIFATGFLALVASALTFLYRIRIIRGIDASWSGAQTYICIQAEVYASIMVACMPALAKIWNSKFKETKFYTSLRSGISIVSFGNFSLHSSKKSTVGVPYARESESTSHLHPQKGYSEINHVSADLEAPPHHGRGIQQTMTVELTSMRADGAVAQRS